MGTMKTTSSTENVKWHSGISVETQLNNTYLNANEFMQSDAMQTAAPDSLDCDYLNIILKLVWAPLGNHFGISQVQPRTSMYLWWKHVEKMIGVPPVLFW